MLTVRTQFICFVFLSRSQADAEAAKYADTDFDDSDWSTQSTTVSTPAFRTYVVHEGICKIVIEILIDLSKRCLTSPNFCLNNLMQIATRLYAIRDLLGGSLYLLRGFAAVLETNDPQLRDFQKAILDLITDLHTPDTLSAYLALMTSANPPLDLLITRFIYLGGHGQSNQPSIEIEFPVFGSGGGGNGEYLLPLFPRHRLTLLSSEQMTKSNTIATQ